MKKIYLIAMAGILMLSAKVSNAQDICTGMQRAVSTPIGPYCYVIAQGLPADAYVALFDAALNVIPTAPGIKTTFSGSVSIAYPCDRVPAKIYACLATGCCETMITAQAPLPVKLSAFSANLTNSSTVALKWTSSLEISSFKYVIQKSNDGLNFSDIGELPASGNSVSAVNYAFTDNNFLSGASYFRLKQVDIDGKVEFSKIVYVNNRTTGGLVKTVTPNPFISDVQLIGISASELNSGNVQVFNSFGQRIRYRINGSNSIEIDPSSARGIYILKVRAQTFKLVKN